MRGGGVSPLERSVILAEEVDRLTRVADVANERAEQLALWGAPVAAVATEMQRGKIFTAAARLWARWMRDAMKGQR